MLGLRLIDNARRDLHRFWVNRIAIAYACFTGTAMVLSAFVDVFNPWFLLAVSIFVSIAIVVLRMVKQKDPMGPIA
jgi:uncharacterized membrane protein